MSEKKEIINPLADGVILQGKSGNYRIEKALGQGSFGITYLASVIIKGALGMIDTGGKVAIKEFFMKDVNGRQETTVTTGGRTGIFDDYKNKFVREAENLSKLEHPQIVKVLELIHANNTVYYVMEYHAGGSLDEYISKLHNIPEDEALGFIKQIGVALSYMHDRKMLHLDLKPGNVMLDSGGKAVLIDFGLSKQYDENGEPESSTTIGGGTRGYAPIEQFNYRAGHDFPVTMDVYALGATLYKMLTGQSPLEASIILNEGFPIYEMQEKGVSDHTISCVVKAMMPMKKDRCPSVREFLSLLDKKDESSNVSEETFIEPDIKTEVPPIDINKSGISIFYENTINGKAGISILDNGCERYLGLDENLLLFNVNGGVTINERAMDEFDRKTCIMYDSLKTHLYERDIKHKILNSRRAIIAYDDRISYCDALRLIIDIFGSVPSNFYIINKLHLAAFYCGVSRMTTDNDSRIRLICGNSSCRVVYEDGVAEIREDIEYSSMVWYPTEILSPDSSKELLAGAVLQYLILYGYKQAKDKLLLNAIPFNISCGFLNYGVSERLVDRYTTIPIRGVIDLDRKGSELDIVLGTEKLRYPLLGVNDESIRIEVEIDGNGIIKLTIISSSDKYYKTVLIQDLLCGRAGRKSANEPTEPTDKPFTVRKDTSAVYVKYVAPFGWDEGYSYAVTNEKLKDPNRYQRFLRDLQNLNIRVRKEEIAFNASESSEVPERFDLWFYDENGKIYEHLWVTGWNRECGNMIIGGINLKDKLKEIVPGLKEYLNPLVDEPEEPKNSGNRKASGSSREKPKPKKATINQEKKSNQKSNSQENVQPDEKSEDIQEKDKKSKWELVPFFSILIIVVIAYLYSLLVPFFQASVFGWTSPVLSIVGYVLHMKGKTLLGLFVLFVAVCITTAGFFF